MKVALVEPFAEHVVQTPADQATGKAKGFLRIVPTEAPQESEDQTPDQKNEQRKQQDYVEFRNQLKNKLKQPRQRTSHGKALATYLWVGEAFEAPKKGQFFDQKK